jgi:hypothetical protein
VTDEALALAFRSGLPFVGLRDHAADPDLDRIVPPDAARTARALPLTAEDHHIRLAVADPDADLSALDPYLTGRQVALALAPREELDAILGPPPAVAEPEPPADEVPEQVAATDDEHEPLTAQDSATADRIEPDPPTAAPSDHETEPLAAEAQPAAPRDAGEPEPAGEPDPEALSVGGASDVADVAERAAPSPDEIGDEVGPVAEAAAPSAPVDDRPELAGELPSWLEPPPRGRRVVLTVLIVIVVLAVAAAVVVAFLNA